MKKAVFLVIANRRHGLKPRCGARCGGGREAGRRTARRSIFVSVDTLRANHLPAYGYQKVRTPNIDALAAASVLFENAYSHAPQTLPAHTSILSGYLPFEHGVRDNVGFKLKPGQWIVQQALRERGWPTGGFVSAYVLRAATGINQGFDTFDSDMPAASGELSIGQVQRDGDRTLAAAEKWLRLDDEQPFFLFLHIYEPHKPYAPPQRFSSYEPYDGEIAYADEIVGRLVDRLQGASTSTTARRSSSLRSRRRARRSRRAGARAVSLRERRTCRSS